MSVCVVRLHEAMPCVVKQLQLLWCNKMIRILFLELFEYVDVQRASDNHRASNKDKGNQHATVCVSLIS